jgi:nitrite reductase/ring-hydroxylating ferredoxin subunit
MEDKAYSAELLVNPVVSTGKAQTHEFVRAGTLEELKSKGRLLVHGPHRSILVIDEQDRVYALDNRCPHMGFPLDRGSVEDGILTCHWHHARFDLASVECSRRLPTFRLQSTGSSKKPTPIPNPSSGPLTPGCRATDS